VAPYTNQPGKLSDKEIKKLQKNLNVYTTTMRDLPAHFQEEMKKAANGERDRAPSQSKHDTYMKSLQAK
jgi:hypothetical protein